MRRRTMVAGVVAVAALTGTGLWWNQTGKSPQGETAKAAAPAGTEARPVPVVLAEVVAQPVAERLSTIGAAQSVATVAIRARIDSVVEQVHFTEGQEVQEGDLLFSLDDRSLKAQLAQAQANLERDRAQLEKSRSDVVRLGELVRQNAAPRQQYDTAVAAANALEGTIKANQAAIESARIALSHTRIVAPMTARTGAVAARPGASVRPGDAAPLVTLTQLRPINVAFNVAERQLPALRQAMAQGPVTVTARVPGEGNPDPVEGRLVFIDSQVEQQSGTIIAKAEFPNAETRLWPGQFVDVTVILRTDPQALTVPVEAVQASQKGPFVYVIGERKTAEMRPVTVARMVDGLAVIAAGVKAGEKVVRDGAARLMPGGPVVEAGRPAAKPVNGS